MHRIDFNGAVPARILGGGGEQNGHYSGQDVKVYIKLKNMKKQYNSSKNN